MRLLSLFALVISIVLGGCTCPPLTVQTHYFTPEDLASFVIGTPDPRLDHPAIGERLLIQWSLSAGECVEPDLELYLRVRLRDHTEREVKFPIQNNKGYYLYELMDEDYLNSGGILTYVAEIRRGSCIVAEWKHPLWTNLIDFGKNT